MEDYNELSREELISRLSAAESQLRFERSENQSKQLKHEKEASKSRELLDLIIPLAIDLSAEKDLNQLFKKILLGARGLCNADGGTIYIKNGSLLEFKVIQNESLNIEWNDSAEGSISFNPLSIFDDQTGDVNINNVATLSAANGETVNVKDAYQSQDFDFSGTKIFDQKNNYRSMSFLTVPLKNYDNHVIGVLQLINARVDGNKIIPFSEEKQVVVEALSSLAASALENSMLLKAQKDLLDSFIKLISDGIDQKSPYTGGHCKRVPFVAELIAKAACESEKEPFKSFNLNESEMYELKTAAWLHDIGKITTPEYVVDKATKLETIFDRVQLVKSKFATLKTQIEMSDLEEPIKLATLTNLKEDFDFIQTSNLGGEFMTDESKQRISEIAKLTFENFDGEREQLLSENEVYNLCIERGTLTQEEKR